MAVMNDTFFWDGDRWYGEQELFCAWRTFFKPGVRQRDDGSLDYNCTVSGNKITTTGGLAYVNGCFRYDENERSLTVGVTGACSLVIRADYSKKTCDLQIIEGTMPTRNDTIYDLLLYRLNSTGTSVTITEDCRADSNVCGVCQARATTDLDKQLQQLLDNYRDALDGLGSDNREIYVQSFSPDPKTNGALWFDTKNNIVYYSHNGRWTALVSSGSGSESGTPRYFGACVMDVASGIVRQGETLKIPFKTSLNDISAVKMPYAYTDTDYCYLQPSGEVYIKKSGFYSVTMNVHVSDAGANNEFQLGLFKNQGNNSTSTGNGKMCLSQVYVKKFANRQAGGACAATCYLQAGDKLSGYVMARQAVYTSDGVDFSTTYENLTYRLHGHYTYITLVPVNFDRTVTNTIM